MKIEFDGVTYTPEELERHRQDIIFLRDKALEQYDFNWSIILSHNIAILACVLEELRK